MLSDRFSSSTTCSRWRHETEPGQLDQSLSCRFWKVATHPRTDLDASLTLIVEVLANNKPLEPRHYDHALSGEWGDHRDCHVKPDLVLIYQKSGADTLRLVRLGSHAELGL